MLTNNLAALYFCAIAKAIPKKYALHLNLLSLLFERNEFLELPLTK